MNKASEWSTMKNARSNTENEMMNNNKVVDDEWMKKKLSKRKWMKIEDSLVNILLALHKFHWWTINFIVIVNASLNLILSAVL